MAFSAIDSAGARRLVCKPRPIYAGWDYFDDVYLFLATSVSATWCSFIEAGVGRSGLPVADTGIVFAPGGNRLQVFVGGFGENDWNLDVAYDLSTVVEQLPSLMSGLRARADVELDLYSQGIERTLTFARVKQDVTIKCCSQTSWVPNPDTEVVPFCDLESMFVQLAEDFVASAELVDPGISLVLPFADWRAEGSDCLRAQAREEGRSKDAIISAGRSLIQSHSMTWPDLTRMSCALSGGR